MSFLYTNLIIGVFIIIIVLIRALGMHKLPQKTLLILWGIALFRLLFPVSLSSRLSIYNLLNDTIARGAERAETAFYGSLAWSGAASQMDFTNIAYSQPFVIMHGIWLAGIMTAAAFFVVLYYKNWKILRCALPVVEDKAIGTWMQESLLKRKISIFYSDKIATPLTSGILEPRIILPTGFTEKNSSILENVLTHEYYHIKKLDNLKKLLLIIAVCIYWFNPMVWIMFILANRDIELSCDELVIKKLGYNKKMDYAYSLVEMAEMRSQYVPFCSGFSKNAVEERIVSIMKFKKKSIATIIFSLLLVLGATIVFASNGKLIGGSVVSPMTVDEEARYQQVMKDYAANDIIEIDGNYYYLGQRVGFLYDNYAGTKSHFSGLVVDWEPDESFYCLEIKRDLDKEFVSIRQLTREEADKLATWR